MAASTPHESQTALLGHEAHPHRLTEEEHRWAVALRQKLDLEGIPQPETDFLLVSGSCCGCMLQTLTWSARPRTATLPMHERNMVHSFARCVLSEHPLARLFELVGCLRLVTLTRSRECVHSHTCTPTQNAHSSN